MCRIGTLNAVSVGRPGSPLIFILTVIMFLSVITIYFDVSLLQLSSSSPPSRGLGRGRRWSDVPPPSRSAGHAPVFRGRPRIAACTRVLYVVYIETREMTPTWPAYVAYGVYLRWTCTGKRATALHVHTSVRRGVMLCAQLPGRPPPRRATVRARACVCWLRVCRRRRPTTGQVLFCCRAYYSCVAV